MRGYRAPRAFDGERLLPDGALVLVEGRTIVGVQPATAPAPDGCAVTDVPDGTLLPGLIDTHVHLCADSSPAALDQVPARSPAELRDVITASAQEHLRAGVTSVRDLGDHRWAVLDHARANDVGPTVVGSGPPLTSPGGHCSSMGGEVSGGPGAIPGWAQDERSSLPVVDRSGSGRRRAAASTDARPRRRSLTREARVSRRLPSDGAI